MHITVQIPDDLVQQLAAEGEGIERRALEAFGVEEFRVGRLTKSELRRLLGFSTRMELDGFLKARGVFEPYDADDITQDLVDLQRAGI